MFTIVGRPLGLWSVLTILFGAAVIIPSIAALIVTLLAVAAAIF